MFGGDGIERFDFHPLGSFGVDVEQRYCFLALLHSTVGLHFFGFASFSWALLKSHHEKGEIGTKTLLSVWPICWTIFRLPRSLQDALNEFVSTGIIEFCDSLLKLLRLPHVVYDSAIGLTNHRVYVGDTIAELFPWGLFLTLALIHTAIFKRNWVESLFNGVTSFVCWIIFGATWILADAYSHFRWDLDTESLWVRVLLAGVTLLFTAAIFLSWERFWRVVFFPIQDKEDGSMVANPAIEIFNRIFAGVVSRSSKLRSAVTVPEFGLGLPLVIVFALVTLGVHGVRFSSAYRAALNSQDVFTSRFDRRPLTMC